MNEINTPEPPVRYGTIQADAWRAGYEAALRDRQASSDVLITLDGFAFAYFDQSRFKSGWAIVGITDDNGDMEWYKEPWTTSTGRIVIGACYQGYDEGLTTLLAEGVSEV